MNRGDINIDELLNSYIDGELSQEQQIEVHQLIADDDQIAHRLRDLQRCKMLVACLPRAQAPTEIFSFLVARKPLRRRVLAVAAVAALMAVSAAVIYSIFAPKSAADRSIPGVTVATRFGGKLELTTSDLTAVDAFINRVIKDNELSNCVHTASLANRKVYSFRGGRGSLNLLLTDLATIWERFGSAKLIVETPKFGEQIIVDTVTAAQVAQIARQEHWEESIRLAKDFAVLNNMADSLPGKEILAATGENKPSLITIPKPVLTGDSKTVKHPTPADLDTKDFELTIVVKVPKVLSD